MGDSFIFSGNMKGAIVNIGTTLNNTTQATNSGKGVEDEAVININSQIDEATCLTCGFTWQPETPTEAYDSEGTCPNCR